MLHATYRHKTRLPQQQYASATSLGAARRTQEDEITSTVFGPLTLMPHEVAYRFWKRLVKEEPGDTRGCKAHTELWPRTGAIEPDLRITLEHSNGQRQVIVVEVKWNAPLHTNQLPEQWRQSFSSAEREDGWHVFIGKNTFQASSREQRHARLKALTWLDFADILRDTTTTAGDVFLERWAALVITFLRACGISHFRGFGHLEMNDLSGRLRPSADAVFWQGWRGWSTIPALSAHVDDASTPLIFSQGNPI